MAKTPKDDRLVYLVFTAQNKLKLHVRDELMASGVKITIVQAAILFLLMEQDGRPMSDLSRTLSLDNSTVTGLVDRLEKAGFVQRKANPNDRRVSLIHITPPGVDEARKAAIVTNRVNDEIKANFSKQELDAFKKILNSFVTSF